MTKPSVSKDMQELEIFFYTASMSLINTTPVVNCLSLLIKIEHIYIQAYLVLLCLIGSVCFLQIESLW